MAGLQMPKRGDGAAMLRELRDDERPALTEERPTPDAEPPQGKILAGRGVQPLVVEPSVLTELRASVSTDARKGLSTQVSEEGHADTRTGASTDAAPQARKPVRKPVSQSVSERVRPPARATSEEGQADFLETVDEALASREPLVGGVKATVDMSPDLSTRAKRYLADHRGQNTRQVLIALFDAFLSAKGY